MKPITLHPLSVLAGLVLSGALVVLAGAAQAPGGVQSIPTRDVRVVGIGEIPAEWWVYFELGVDQACLPTSSFVVPQDRWLVLTIVTAASSQPVPSPPRLVVDGVPAPDFLTSAVWTPLGGFNQGDTRITFPPGSVIHSATCGYIVGAWGYLQPVR